MSTVYKLFKVLKIETTSREHLEMSSLPSSTEGDENSCCESEVENGLENIIQQQTLSQTPVNSQSRSQPERSHDAGSTSGGPTRMATEHEERMRRRLQFFFMNPIQKWKAKRKFPYKFFVQVC